MVPHPSSRAEFLSASVTGVASGPPVIEFNVLIIKFFRLKSPFTDSAEESRQFIPSGVVSMVSCVTRELMFLLKAPSAGGTFKREL